jgi:hypothetical protein
MIIIGDNQGGHPLARSNYKFEKRQKELAKKKKKEQKQQLKQEKNTNPPQNEDDAPSTDMPDEMPKDMP